MHRVLPIRRGRGPRDRGQLQRHQPGRSCIHLWMNGRIRSSPTSVVRMVNVTFRSHGSSGRAPNATDPINMTTRFRSYSASSVAFVLVATDACRSGTELCHATYVPPVIVEVRDASTGDPAASSAAGTMSLGDRTVTLSLPFGGPTPPLSLRADSGGPGIYDVMVTKPGYRDWVRNDVLVRGSTACGADRSVILTARLERLP